MAHDIFISYSSKDKQTADAICHVLESNKLKCWIAPRNIIAGKNYAAQIMYGLKHAKIVVLVFSKNSQNSIFVNNEIDAAFSNNKPIISFKIDESLPEKKMEFFLKNKHWLDAYPNPEDVFERLVHDARLLCDEHGMPNGLSEIEEEMAFEEAFLDDDTASKHRAYPHLSSAHNDVFDEELLQDDVESEGFSDSISNRVTKPDDSNHSHISSSSKDVLVDESSVDESSVDESSVDVSSVDESSVDDGSVVDSVVDGSVVDSVVDESSVDDGSVVDSVVEKKIKTEKDKQPKTPKQDYSQLHGSSSKLKLLIIIAIVAVVAIVGVLAFGGIGSDNTSTVELIDIDYIDMDDDRNSNFATDYSCFVMGSISSEVDNSSDYVIHTDFLDDSGNVVTSNETKLKDFDGNVLGMGFVNKNNIAKVSVELRDGDNNIISTAQSDNIH